MYGLGAVAALGLAYYAYRSVKLDVEGYEGPTAGAPERPTVRVQDVSALKPPSDKPPQEGAPAQSTSCSTSPHCSRTCDFCGKQEEDSRHLLRCSRCKDAYYCGESCQRLAWTSHKKECKRKSRAPVLGKKESLNPGNGRERHAEITDGAALVGGAGGLPPRNNQEMADAPQGPSHETMSTTATGADDEAADSNGPPDTKEDSSMLDRIHSYLSQATSNKTDPLERALESGVLKFIHGDHRGAVGELTLARELAERQGNAAAAGDVCRWLGHAYKQLLDFTSAERNFQEGYDKAVTGASKKLQVDCLSGLAALHLAQGNPDKAVEVFERALVIAEETQDIGTCAAVRVNLGSALMDVDKAAALKHLEVGADLREQQVVNLHGDKAALATCIMEYGSALLNLAAACFHNDKYDQAEESYLRCQQIWGMVGEMDRMAKVVVNLANLCELQNWEPRSRSKACAYRQQLYEVVETYSNGTRAKECRLCGEALDIAQESPASSPLIILPCFHCYHKHCWDKQDKDADCRGCQQDGPVSFEA